MAKEHSHCHVQPERQYSCKRAAGLADSPGVQLETSGAERIPSWSTGERSNDLGLQDTSDLSAQRKFFFCMMLNGLKLLAVSLRQGRGCRNSLGCLGLERRDSLAKHLAFPF